VKQVRITGHGPFPYQVDGDYLGEVESLDFRHEPEALRLVLP
jgi:diacylglycerol kinase family enzyme